MKVAPSKRFIKVDENNKKSRRFWFKNHEKLQLPIIWGNPVDLATMHMHFFINYLEISLIVIMKSEYTEKVKTIQFQWCYSKS